MQMPIITLPNGITIGNFCSPLHFWFEPNIKLPACDEDRVSRLSPTVKILNSGECLTHVVTVNANTKNAIAALRKPKFEKVKYVIITAEMYYALQDFELLDDKFRIPLAIKSHAIKGTIHSSSIFLVNPAPKQFRVVL